MTARGERSALPWPREMTPGRMPASRKACTSQIVSGVLPVPPIKILPTTTTGTGRRADVRMLARYKTRRTALRAPNSRDTGHSAHASGPRVSQARVNVVSSLAGEDVGMREDVRVV